MKNLPIYLLILGYTIIAAFTIYYFNGTGDSGDSIYHYLFAKYAPIHPTLFFNHWAKPLYVLIFSPFAQFGFVSVKVLNSIISIAIIFLTYKIIQKLKIKKPIIGSLILICSPLYFVLTFSGLTEYLFALFVCIGFYSLFLNRTTFSIIIISFLPFIRSEGLIIIGVFAFYLFLKKQWKYIPLLLFGHIIYSIAGYFAHKDFLWVFNQIPYARLSSIYGNGNLFHFIEQLLYVVGVPIYILFWIGAVYIIWQSIYKKTSVELRIIVMVGFFAFFISHTIFWYLGIFNSMGLKRVLISIAPFTAIISLIGFNFITDVFLNQKKWKYIIQCILIAYIIIFPFTSNPSAIKAERDLILSKDQESAIQVADFIQKNVSQNHRFMYTHPYLSEVLHIDHFDSIKRIDFTDDILNNTSSGDIIIWENWFAVVENGISKEYLDTLPMLLNIYNSNVLDRGREVIYSVYIRN